MASLQIAPTFRNSSLRLFAFAEVGHRERWARPFPHFPTNMTLNVIRKADRGPTTAVHAGCANSKVMSQNF
jgi:hypothetical protein